MECAPSGTMLECQDMTVYSNLAIKVRNNFLRTVLGMVVVEAGGNLYAFKRLNTMHLKG